MIWQHPKTFPPGAIQRWIIISRFEFWFGHCFHHRLSFCLLLFLLCLSFCMFLSLSILFVHLSVLSVSNIVCLSVCFCLFSTLFVLMSINLGFNHRLSFCLLLSVFHHRLSFCLLFSVFHHRLSFCLFLSVFYIVCVSVYYSRFSTSFAFLSAYVCFLLCLSFCLCLSPFCHPLSFSLFLSLSILFVLIPVLSVFIIVCPSVSLHLRLSFCLCSLLLTLFLLLFVCISVCLSFCFSLFSSLSTYVFLSVPNVVSHFVCFFLFPWTKNLVLKLMKFSAVALFPQIFFFFVTQILTWEMLHVFPVFFSCLKSDL